MALTLSIQHFLSQLVGPFSFILGGGRGITYLANTSPTPVATCSNVSNSSNVSAKNVSDAMCIGGNTFLSIIACRNL